MMTLFIHLLFVIHCSIVDIPVVDIVVIHFISFHLIICCCCCYSCSFLRFCTCGSLVHGSRVCTHSRLTLPVLYASATTTCAPPLVYTHHCRTFGFAHGFTFTPAPLHAFSSSPGSFSHGSGLHCTTWFCTHAPPHLALHSAGSHWFLLYSFTSLHGLPLPHLCTTHKFSRFVHSPRIRFTFVAVRDHLFTSRIMDLQFTFLLHHCLTTAPRSSHYLPHARLPSHTLHVYLPCTHLRFLDLGSSHTTALSPLHTTQLDTACILHVPRFTCVHVHCTSALPSRCVWDLSFLCPHSFGSRSFLEFPHHHTSSFTFGYALYVTSAPHLTFTWTARGYLTDFRSARLPPILVHVPRYLVRSFTFVRFLDLLVHYRIPAHCTPHFRFHVGFTPSRSRHLHTCTLVWFTVLPVVWVGFTTFAFILLRLVLRIWVPPLRSPLQFTRTLLTHSPLPAGLVPRMRLRILSFRYGR